MSDHDTLPRPRHELTDVAFRPMLVAAIAMAVALLGLAAFALWMFPASIHDKAIALPLPQAAQPALQPSPRADMAAFRRRQLRHLDSLGWIDRSRGIVHVPIADAMQDTVRDGIPGWPAATPP